MFSGSFGETIRQSAQGERKYIRYLDGRGRFAHLRLDLIRTPGLDCTITAAPGLALPEVCMQATRTALTRAYSRGPLRRLPMLGFAIRITGATFKERYSDAEAFGFVAAMAFDEALQRAAPVIVERWTGVRFRVSYGQVPSFLAKLSQLVGQAETVARYAGDFEIEAELPRRFCAKLDGIAGVIRTGTYPLAAAQSFRPVPRFPPESDTDALLRDWT